MTDIRVTNAAIMVEDELDQSIRVTNAAIDIEYGATNYLRVENAGIDIEYSNTNYLRVENVAIMVEYYDSITGVDCYHLQIADSGMELPLMEGPQLGDSGLIVYSDFEASQMNYFTRPDEPGLSITGELTLGCWVWFDTESTNAATGLLSKWDTNDEWSYVLYKTAGNVLTFGVSTDGTTAVTIGDAAANYAISRWLYVVGRFTPNSEMALFINGTWYTDLTDIPGSIYDGTAAFDIGRYGGGNYLDGRISHAFLSAVAIPDRFIEAMYAHSKAMFMSR